MRAKLPKTRKALNTLLQTSYNDGYRTGKEHSEAAAKAQLEQLAQKRNAVHLEALREATRMASAFGQAIDSLTRGMQSEKGQL